MTQDLASLVVRERKGIRQNIFFQSARKKAVWIGIVFEAASTRKHENEVDTRTRRC